MQNKEYTEGHDAATLGLPLNTNPYDEVSEASQYTQWVFGWQAAKSYGGE